jgi:hypothetical protein
MGYVALSPQQFTGLEEAAKTNKQIESVTITGDYTGIVVTHDVTIDYTYDPLKQILSFNIGAKHSLAAKIAGDNVISNHIVALIHGLNFPTPAPAPTEEPAPNPVPTAPIDSVTV